MRAFAKAIWSNTVYDTNFKIVPVEAPNFEFWFKVVWFTHIQRKTYLRRKIFSPQKNNLKN